MLVRWLKVEGPKASIIHDEALATLAAIAAQHCAGPHIRLQSHALWDMLPFQGLPSSAALLFSRVVFTCCEAPLLVSQLFCRALPYAWVIACVLILLDLEALSNQWQAGLVGYHLKPAQEAIFPSAILFAVAVALACDVCCRECDQGGIVK